MTGVIERVMGPQIDEALGDMPVVVLVGARQTGKSTLLEQRFPKRRYVTLDDFATLEAARRDPDALVAGETPITIDEAQRAPELLLAIKRAVDRRRVPGRYLLSGSSNFELASGVSESLAGRAVTLTLHPMSFAEIERSEATPMLARIFAGKTPAGEPSRSVSFGHVLRGGFPVPALGHVKNRDLWFRGYVQTYLERDVRELSAIADLVPFRSVTRLAALRTSQILNIADLARDAKVSPATAGRYLAVLEASFLVRRLPPFLRNRASRVVKAPKLVFTDSGLAAHLAGVVDVSDVHAGAMLETFVYQNLMAIAEAHLDGANVLYWNVQGRHEVDFVVEHKRDVIAIEVKNASRWGPSDLRALEAFIDATPDCRAAILAYGGSTIAKLGDRLWAVPLGALLA